MTDREKKFRMYLDRLANYKTVLMLLEWDLQTAAPEGGEQGLMDAISYVSTEQFRLLTDQSYGKLLEELAQPEEYEQLDEGLKVTVDRYRKDYEENQRIPEEFYAELVRTSTRSQRAWEKAKRASDYSMFCPWLQKMIDLKRQQYGYTNPGEEVYEAMLEDFEPGMDSKTIDRLFSELKEELLPLVKKIAEKTQPDSRKAEGKIDHDSQRHLQDFLLDYIGFSHEKGTTGESEHPFTTTISYGDVRVTNHFREDNAINAMFTAIHEGGHAIFEQNIRPEFAKTAVAEVNWMGLHESQSRFFENILGRNIHFWEPIYDKVCEFLPDLKKLTLEEFEREMNRVQCSMIRTDADEVTFAFHIILRYELERAIFQDQVKAEQLPELWNQKMRELLGITPENDAEGILQDVHWSDGSFGYFPSYLLGSIYDGMFLEAMEKELGSVDDILAQGRIKELTCWLNEKIHQNGSLYTSQEVLQRVCGSEVTALPLIRHFKKKYTKLYQL